MQKDQLSTETINQLPNNILDEEEVKIEVSRLEKVLMAQNQETRFSHRTNTTDPEIENYQELDAWKVTRLALRASCKDSTLRSNVRKSSTIDRQSSFMVLDSWPNKQLCLPHLDPNS